MGAASTTVEATESWQGPYSAPDELELAFAGIDGQARLLREHKLSVKELIEYTLERIQRLDKHLNTFRVVLAEQAMEAVEAAQKRIDSGDESRLVGIPIAIKDDCDVKGVSTMIGTGIDPGPASDDAVLVRKLREAGAIIIGKTHLSEIGALPMCESYTWGVTRNPWDFKRSTGGSSGGSASAVAAGLVPGAIGSDGGGSVRIPAACCGVFGLKPERGMVSIRQSPERDYSFHGIAHYGPITRAVLDSAIIHDAIQGHDPGQKIPYPGSPGAMVDAASRTPRKLRIAYSFKPILAGVKVSDEVKQTVLEAAELLKGLGHTVEPYDPKTPITASLSNLALMLRAGAQELGRLPDKALLEKRTQLIIKMGRRVPKSVERLALALRGGSITRHIKSWRKYDILMTPVLAKPPVEVGHWEGVGQPRSDIQLMRLIPFTPVQNFTGHPAASLPFGFYSDGMPRSVHLVGHLGNELDVISLSAQMEENHPWADKRPPFC